jgi:hypothetical protein
MDNTFFPQIDSKSLEGFTVSEAQDVWIQISTITKNQTD